LAAIEIALSQAAGRCCFDEVKPNQYRVSSEVEKVIKSAKWHRYKNNLNIGAGETDMALVVAIVAGETRAKTIETVGSRRNLT